MAVQPQPPAGGVDPNNPNPGAPTVFDPAVFEAKLMDLVNRSINGALVNHKKELLKELKPTEPVSDPANPDPNNPPEPEPPRAKSVADLEVRVRQSDKLIQELKATVESEQKTRAEAQANLKEEQRISQVKKALDELSWANPKARQQFFDANLPKVKWDDDGKLFVETDKGPMSHDVFLQLEANESPWFLAPGGQGGAGASAGKKPSAGRGPDVLQMTTKEIASMSPEQQSAALSDALRATLARH